MIDSDFATEAKRLSDLGPEGLPALREHLKGQMPRLIELAVRGATINKPRATTHKLKNEPEGFAEWYAAYPRHVARDAAAAAYARATKRVSGEMLLAGAKRYKMECAGKESHFIAHPASWLNAGRWADEPQGLALVHVASTRFENVTLSAWIAYLKAYHGLDEDFPKGYWRPELGAKPGEPGCRVPQEAFAVFGPSKASTA
jgi:hypothetical protein